MNLESSWSSYYISNSYIFVFSMIFLRIVKLFHDISEVF